MIKPNQPNKKTKPTNQPSNIPPALPPKKSCNHLENTVISLSDLLNDRIELCLTSTYGFVNGSCTQKCLSRKKLPQTYHKIKPTFLKSVILRVYLIHVYELQADSENIA